MDVDQVVLLGRTVLQEVIILAGPILRRDPLSFCFRDFNGVLPAASAAIVTAPVLNRRQF